MASLEELLLHALWSQSSPLLKNPHFSNSLPQTPSTRGLVHGNLCSSQLPPAALNALVIEAFPLVCVATVFLLAQRQKQKKQMHMGRCYNPNPGNLMMETLLNTDILS